MKTFSGLLGVCCGLSLLLGVTTWAQQSPPVGQEPTGNVSSASPQPVPGNSAGTLTSVPGVLLSTSTLLGRDIRNPQGEDIGDLQHLMIDPHTGRVIYAVISMGSILGMGGKTIQVPWESLEIARDGNSFVLQANQPLVPPAAEEERSKVGIPERSQ